MLQRFLTLLFTGTLALGVTGCPSDDDGDGDVDTGVNDTGPKPDSGVADTGTTDTGTTDTGMTDTGMTDTGTPDAGEGPQTMTFFHTNDEHSQHLGRPNVDDYPALSTADTVKGGVFRRARVLEQLAAEAQGLNLPVAIVGGGDVSMGSLFHVGNLVASPDYNVMTQLGYDVSTLGNHEFDFGPATLASMLSTGHLIAGMPPAFDVLKIPLVVSNIRFSMTSPDDDALAAYWSESFDPDQPIVRYYIADYGNVRIGFVGYMGIEAALVAPFKSPVTFSLATGATACTNDTQCPGSVCVPPASDPTSPNGNCALDSSGVDPINFTALVADVATAVAAVRAQNVDLVVAVSHAGVNEQELNMLAAMGMGPENARVSEDILVALGVDLALDAQSIPGIDVIIGGHSHTPLPEPLSVPNPLSGINTFIAQAGSYGNFVGKLRVSRPDRTSPWTLDEGYSGLTEIDGTVSAAGLGFLTQLVLDGLIQQVIDFLESSQLAQPGDGLLFPGEQCDGTVLPNMGNCLGLVPGATGGTLACLPNQQVNLSGCTIPSGGTCGNNTTEAPELCDGTSLPMTCADLGYEGGNIACFGNCAFDFTACTVRFPSLLEAALNFQLLPGDPPIRDNPAMRGDLFFYDLGATAFDIGETTPSNESNLANLIADSARWSVNTLDDDAVGNPVEIAITANGVVRDGIYRPAAGDVLSFSDLFRVMSLGISPQESTPGYTLVDFYLAAPEIKGGLEVGLSNGLTSDSFWLQVSGARVEYDLSLPAFDPANPTTTGRVTKIEIIDPTAGDDPWDDALATYEATPLFDRSLGAGAFPDPNRLVHITTSLYLSLFMEGFGLCPRTAAGAQALVCRSCTMDVECTAPGTTCDETAGRCTGGAPAGFFSRTQVPLGNGFFQELKEVLALTTYIRRLPGPGNVPADYNGGTPRRLCCVGTMCPTDNSRTCN